MTLQLTDEQVMAVASDESLTNIISGPGSGKTTVSAARFGYLHHKDDGDPRGVLGLSFTRSAVGELRSRIVGWWGSRIAELPNLVTTFDDFHVRIFHRLLALGLVTWPGGHRRLEVLDDLRGIHNDFRFLPAGSYRRYAGCDVTGVVDSRSERTPTPTYGFGKVGPHRQVLAAGTISHEDMRRALRTAIVNVPAVQKAILDWLTANFRHVIVDEIYDADELDIYMCRAVAATDATLTVVGDPWQALYDWRGATPDKVHSKLIAAYPFTSYDLQHSFRFATSQTLDLATHLRAGEPVTVQPVTSTAVDVALGRRWDTLWTTGDNVLPLAFRTIGNRTDAALNLLLDEVTRAKLGRKAFGRQSALVHLGMTEEGLEERQRDLLRPILTELVSGLPGSHALEMLRDAVDEMSPRTRPGRLKESAEADRIKEIERLRARLLRSDLIPGLTVHQAKGCEWPRVGVLLSHGDESALAKGLTNENPEHCVLYVALTRAKLMCGGLARFDEIDFADQAG